MKCDTCSRNNAESYEIYCQYCKWYPFNRLDNYTPIEPKEVGNEEPCYICGETEGYHGPYCSRGNKKREENPER